MDGSMKSDVADRLRRALDEGVFAPGERLPREEELAARYGASPATVRSVLRRLQDEGRVGFRSGLGAFVREYRPAVHLATELPGAADSERFDAGYAAHLAAAGRGSATEHIKVVIEEAGPKVAGRLGLLAPGMSRGSSADGPLSPDARLVVVRACDRYVDGVLWESQTNHFPYALVAESALMSPERLSRCVDEVLADLGHVREWSWDIVGARIPTPAESSRFTLGPGVALLVQERVAHSPAAPVRFTETVMPADRHQLLYTTSSAPAHLLPLAADAGIFGR